MSTNLTTDTQTTTDLKMKTTMGTGRRWMGTLLVAAALAPLAACGGKEAEAADEAPAAAAPARVVLAPGDLAVAERATVRAGVALTGSLEPYRVVEVKAQVPGVVAGLSVDRGSAVRQGQTLARIEAQGIQSQAGGARAQVAGAEAQVALARRQLESARTLQGAGAMSEIDLKAAETQYQAALAALGAARAAASGAAEQAGRTRIVSPLTGRVSVRTVSEGEAVNVGQAIVTVVDSRWLELRGQVPVDQAASVREGQPAEFALVAYPGRTLRGTVSRVDPVADPGTRQVGVTLRLPNADGSLIAGLFANGRVETGGTTETVVVPQAAPRTEGSQTFVWVVREGRVEKRAVTLGEQDAARGAVAVLSGLQGGEQVIVVPGEVTEGARVTVRGVAAAGETR